MDQNPKHLFPLFVTDKLAETKRFYVEQAGFRVVHDHPGYLQVAHGAEAGAELCFMKPEKFPGLNLDPFPGHGVIVSIPTPNADEKHAALRAAGVNIAAAPEDRPWGWRSFVVIDPNGVLLDFFHVAKAV